MQELDKEFVEYIVKALVNHPEAVVVTRSVDEMGVLLELTVDPEDMGKVIGKAGATAKSLRTLLRVLASRSESRVNLKIVEPQDGESAQSDKRSDESSDASIEPDDEGSRIVSKHRSDIADFDDDLDI
jgi:predicted RNA-binding protein YlqC (UPF0109 family)